MTPTVAVGPRVFSFVAGDVGRWRVTSATAVIGAGLDRTKRLDVVAGPGDGVGAWSLRGITSNERYVDRAEKTALVGRQEALGREAATHAALIPIRKTAAWWGARAGRATRDPRGAVPSHRDRPALPAGDRTPPASLPRPRARRAVRLPDVVRIRAGARGGVRRAARGTARLAGVGVRRTRGGGPARRRWRDDAARWGGASLMMTFSLRMSAKQQALPVLGIVASLLSGSAMGSADERLAFWHEARATHLKPGTSLFDGWSFFRSAGDELRCRVEFPLPDPAAQRSGISGMAS